MAEISVIVPVYRAEGTLRECIESILGQSRTDFELILVDDGSPDRSGAICDAYAAGDGRIRVIHQENRGAAAARQAGLEQAGGEYILFPDSDDRMDPDMLALMRDGLAETGADLITTGYLTEERGKEPRPSRAYFASGVYDLSRPDREETRAFLRGALYTGRFYTPGIVPSLWSKMIRRSLLEGLPPLRGRPVMGDDAAVTYPAIARARKIAILEDRRPYHYRFSAESLSNAWNPRYFEQADDLLRGMADGLAGCPPMAEALPYYALFILGMGIDQYLFHERRAGRAEKEETLRRAHATWEAAAGRGGAAIDWSGFNPGEAATLQAFIKGESGKVISLVTKRHFSATLKAVMHRGRP